MTRCFKWLIDQSGAVAFMAGLLALWQILSYYELISPLFFPSPARTFSTLWTQLLDGQIWPPTLATVMRMVYGWVAASIFGVILGALIARSMLAQGLLNPILEFMRPMPASAFIPVAILAFGLTNQMSTTIIAFGSLWPVLLAAIQGFRSVDERLYEVADALRLSARERFFKVALPSALPDIMAGARVGLAVALILAVVTEMQASLPGLGQNILTAQRAFRTPELYASVIMLGVIGFVASGLLHWCERHTLRWRQAHG